jgi:hypothetical protein
MIPCTVRTPRIVIAIEMQMKCKTNNGMTVEVVTNGVNPNHEAYGLTMM